MKKRDSMMLYIASSKPAKIIIVCFLMWNIVWFLNWNLYQRHTENYVKTPHSYYREIVDYTCTIVAPKYLRLGGNYAVVNENGIGIIIWPQFFYAGAPEYGIEIPSNENIIYRFYVDENLNYISDNRMCYEKADEDKIRNLLDKYKRDLNKMMQIAKNEWEL